jgi:hypothetical protein
MIIRNKYWQEGFEEGYKKANYKLNQKLINLKSELKGITQGREEERQKIIKKIEKLKYCVKSGIHICERHPENCEMVVDYEELLKLIKE